MIGITKNPSRRIINVTFLSKRTRLKKENDFKMIWYVHIWSRKSTLKLIFFYVWEGRVIKIRRSFIKIGIRNNLKNFDSLTPQLVSGPLLCNLLPLSMLCCNVMLCTVASHIIVQLNSLCSPHNFGKYIWSIAIKYSQQYI